LNHIKAQLIRHFIRHCLPCLRYFFSKPRFTSPFISPKHDEGSLFLRQRAIIFRQRANTFRQRAISLPFFFAKPRFSFSKERFTSPFFPPKCDLLRHFFRQSAISSPKRDDGMQRSPNFSIKS